VQRLWHDHEPSVGAVQCVSECYSLCNPSGRASSATKCASLRAIAPSPRLRSRTTPSIWLIASPHRAERPSLQPPPNTLAVGIDAGRVVIYCASRLPQESPG